VLIELDRAINDFKKAAGSAWKQTVAVLTTEFGRTVRINGDGGTDHGVGTVALLAGGAVNGGKVVGDWPGLAPKNLYEDSDLKATTDLRAVFKGVLSDHLGISKKTLNTTVFPESVKVSALHNLVKTSPASDSAPASAPVALRPELPIARYRRKQRA
jgi:uncharacterized protein (DUF1501 family)